jgi:hypothetical protein
VKKVKKSEEIKLQYGHRKQRTSERPKNGRAVATEQTSTAPDCAGIVVHRPYITQEIQTTQKSSIMFNDDYPYSYSYSELTPPKTLPLFQGIGRAKHLVRSDDFESSSACKKSNAGKCVLVCCHSQSR